MRDKLEVAVLGLTLVMTPTTVDAQAPGSIDDVVEWLDPLVLEETSAALNEDPTLAIDPDGGYIVTDRRAAQVRLYASDGSLLSYFGREGQGPGEFRNLRSAARLSTGEICTVDFEGRLALWDRTGELITDRRLPIMGAMGIAPVDERRVAVVTAPVTARPDSLDVPWVRIVDVRTFEIGPEVLSLPLTLENVSTASSVEIGLNPTLDSRFGLTWSTFDSLWVVDLGYPDRATVLPLESDALGLNTEPVDRFEDRDGFVEWMLTATFPGAAFAAPGGGWLIPLYRRRPRAEGTWGLLRIGDDGSRVWELDRSPRLVATDPVEGILYFEEPTRLVPNQFNRARLRN